MATETDFAFSRFQDGTFTVSLAPPTAIGGWGIRWRLSHHFGADSGVCPDKFVSSGFNGVSGLTVTNSGQGIFNVNVLSSDTSGLDYGNYAQEIRHTDSGQNTLLALGYVSVGP